LDAEWADTDISIEEYSRLLQHSYRDGNPITVLTVSARRNDGFARLEKAIPVVNSHENAGLCIVAGNRKYLSPAERRRNPAKYLGKAAEYVGRHCRKQVLIGSEGVVEEAARLAKKYGFVPFLLLDRDLRENIAITREIAGEETPIAVYAPFHCDGRVDVDFLLGRLGGYILRRRWVQEELAEAGYDGEKVAELLSSGGVDAVDEDVKEVMLRSARHLALYGDESEVRRRLTQLMRMGVDALVILPLVEDYRQIKVFKEVVDDVKHE